MGYMPVPLEAAVEIARRYQKHQVVIVALDRAYSQIAAAAHGVTAMDKVQADAAAQAFSKLFGGDPATQVPIADFRRDYSAAAYKEALELLQEIARDGAPKEWRKVTEFLDRVVAPPPEAGGG